MFFKEHDFEKKINIKKQDFEEKSVFKKHGFEEKFIFKKQISKKFLHTKNLVLTLVLPRKMRKFCVLSAYLKSTILKKKEFSKA